MLTPENMKSMKQLLADLETAQNELYRPQEHVVVFSVCFTIRQSVHSMMKLFLLRAGLNCSPDISLADLYDQCCKLDAEFYRIDFNNIFCTEYHIDECRGKFCVSVDKVTDCLRIANEVKDLLQKKLGEHQN